MSYKFSLRIERDDITMAEAVISVEATAQEIAKGKRTVTRLMNEYARAVTPPPASEKPAPQDPTASTVPAQFETAQDTPPKGASGLLRLCCPKCSRLFSTVLHGVQSECLCKCGHPIDLTAALAPYHFICPSCKKMTWGKNEPGRPGTRDPVQVREGGRAGMGAWCEKLSAHQAMKGASYVSQDHAI